MPAESKARVLIIIPAYNEEKNIADVIENLHSVNPAWDLLVVNDGSRDNTAGAAMATGKASVVNLPCNLGIGGGVQTGFKHARNQGYDIAVQFDGDGQHLASELHKIIGPVERGEADVMIGSRFIGEQEGFQSTFSRRIGIKIFEFINSLIIRQRVTDNTSGFRAYNRKAISFLATSYPSDYPEPEAVILLGKNGFRIREASVRMQERQGGQSSISGLKSLYYMVKVLLGIVMTASRKKVGAR